MKHVVTTPAGRRRYMRILLPHILRERDTIDEYRIWVNTLNKRDLEYFEELESKYHGFITLDRSANGTSNYGSSLAIHNFYPNCTDENTVYTRLDDDIVWIEKGFFKKIYEFRVANPQYFLVYGNIVNNSIIDHLHQKMGCLPEIKPEIGYKCMDKYGWGDAGICVLKHEALLENIMGNKLKKYKFDHHVAKDYERISINAISWLGSEFAKFGGKVGTDEEKWLSEIKPAEIKMPNVIFGGALCCHFAFYVQRAQVDKTHLLAWYKKISVEESRSSLR